MNRIVKYLLIGSVPVILLILFNFSTTTDNINRWKEFTDNYRIYALDIPQKATFANEELPLSILDVRERLDRELLVNTYWQSQTLFLIKRKERWFPVIEPILKAQNIPDDFKYLALAESGLTNVVSPSGAAGFWQFLETTGTQYGLEINSEVDERYHLEKATIAACAYLKEAYSIFNNWSLVAASYNMGIDGIRKQMENQGASDYYDLLLVEETSRYVFRIVALKEICSNPLNYGFHLRKRDLYPPYTYKMIAVDSSITDLADFALSQGINYKELKLLNPWLRTPTLTNKSKKKYDIKIFTGPESYTSNPPADTVWIKSFPEGDFHRE